MLDELFRGFVGGLSTVEKPCLLAATKPVQVKCTACPVYFILPPATPIAPNVVETVRSSIVAEITLETVIAGDIPLSTSALETVTVRPFLHDYYR